MPRLLAVIKKADRLNRVDQSVRMRIELEVDDAYSEEFAQFQTLEWGKPVFLTTDNILTEGNEKTVS